MRSKWWEAFGEASTPKELKDEIDPCESEVQTLMGPQSGVTDGSRSEPAGTPAQWTLRESIEQG